MIVNDERDQAGALQWSREVHDLKCWPEQFEALADGRKTAEYRYDDREFALGDPLVLREWNPQTAEYTDRTLYAEITWIDRAPAFGIRHRHVVMSVLPVNPYAPRDGRGIS